MKKSKAKKKEPALGQMASRFVDYLDTGLHEFGQCFEEFEPHYIGHEEYGMGLLFSQLPVDEVGADKAAETSVIVTEDGVRFRRKGLVCFNNEQPPEKVALLFLSALVQGIPVLCPLCEDCENETDENEKDDCMREFIPGLDD